MGCSSSKAVDETHKRNSSPSTPPSTTAADTAAVTTSRRLSQLEGGVKRDLVCSCRHDPTHKKYCGFTEVTPTPGFVIKTYRHGQQKVKVFINILVCHRIDHLLLDPNIIWTADKTGNEVEAYNVLCIHRANILQDEETRSKVCMDAITSINKLLSESLSLEYSTPRMARGFIGEAVGPYSIPLACTAGMPHPPPPPHPHPPSQPIGTAGKAEGTALDTSATSKSPTSAPPSSSSSPTTTTPAVTHSSMLHLPAFFSGASKATGPTATTTTASTGSASASVTGAKSGTSNVETDPAARFASQFPTPRRPFKRRTLIHICTSRQASALTASVRDGISTSKPRRRSHPHHTTARDRKVASLSPTKTVDFNQTLHALAKTRPLFIKPKHASAPRGLRFWAKHHSTFGLVALDRYFVLDSGILNCYLQDHNSHPYGTNLQSTWKLHAYQLAPPADPSSRDALTITIHNSGTKFSISAADPSSRDCIIRSLELHIVYSKAALKTHALSKKSSSSPLPPATVSTPTIASPPVPPSPSAGTGKVAMMSPTPKSPSGNTSTSLARVFNNPSPPLAPATPTSRSSPQPHPTLTHSPSESEISVDENESVYSTTQSRNSRRLSVSSRLSYRRHSLLGGPPKLKVECDAHLLACMGFNVSVVAESMEACDGDVHIASATLSKLLAAAMQETHLISLDLIWSSPIQPRIISWISNYVEPGRPASDSYTAYVVEVTTSTVDRDMDPSISMATKHMRYSTFHKLHVDVARHSPKQLYDSASKLFPNDRMSSPLSLSSEDARSKTRLGKLNLWLECLCKDPVLMTVPEIYTIMWEAFS